MLDRNKEGRVVCTDGSFQLPWPIEEVDLTGLNRLDWGMFRAHIFLGGSQQCISSGTPLV